MNSPNQTFSAEIKIDAVVSPRTIEVCKTSDAQRICKVLTSEAETVLTLTAMTQISERLSVFLEQQDKEKSREQNNGNQCTY